MATVTFPDVEKALWSYLRPLLPGVVVDRVIPQSPPAKLVVVRGDGGPQQSVVTEDVRVGVSVWADTEGNAAALTDQVRALIVAAEGVPPFVRVSKTGGPVAVDETGYVPARQVRYMTFLIRTRATVTP